MSQDINTKIANLQKAIWKLEQAAEFVREALGNTDAGDITVNDIHSIIIDIQHDVSDLKETA